MKKLILTFLLSTLIISCSDDDSNLNVPESIVNTTWEATIIEDVQGVTVTIIATLEFDEEDGNFDLIGSGSNGNSINESRNFIYTYSNGNGTLLLDDSDVEDNFTVSGNILNVLGEASEGGVSLNGEDIDFIKQ